MSDHDHAHHHHHHRPHRLSVPPRAPNSTLLTTTSRSYPLYPYSSTPTPTPSKNRLSSFPSINSRSSTKTSSPTTLFLLLFSLRSLYSLLPFVRSSPSFSLFPFSFLVSSLSFLLTLTFSLKHSLTLLSLHSITQSQLHLLLAKSILLATVFLLRFQALRYCGTAATILAELSGNISARFFTEKSNRNEYNNSSKVRGFCALFLGLSLLSISWDRMECFPLSLSNMRKTGFHFFHNDNCLRILPMLLPFLSGFLGCYERVSTNWVPLRQLGKKRVQLVTLLFTTMVLFFPALVSFFLFEEEGVVVSVANLSWPLVNVVLFQVLLTENYSDDKFLTSKDFQKEFVVIFVSTLVLELFYFPELSLLGLLFCGLLLWISIRELDPVVLKYPELGFDTPASFSSMIMKPIRHILSERKSRKIALFLLINTGYMVVEFVVGFMSNSLGLLSDACHMLFDCAALAIGLYASYISRLPANSQFNYGRGRFEVLSGYVNAVLLVLVGALIVLESFERMLDPQEISTGSLLTVSIGGLVVNVVGLIFFHEEHHHAHGGGNSCSHSHSHSHSHEHHHHSHDVHDHSLYDEHNVLKSHGESLDDHVHHDHSHDHVHHDHSHHDHHDHSHHDHHDHSGGDKSAPIAQQEQAVLLHDHKCHGDHQSNEHEHDCHDHGHQHDHSDHHDHGHLDKHVHRKSMGNLSSLQTESHDSHSHHEFHVHSNNGNQNGYPISSHSQSHQSEFRRQSLLENSVSQKKDPHVGKNHHHVDHNMEGIFLHVLADTMGSVGVVISTLLIKYKGWLIADPVCSIFISIMIVASVISLMRNSAEILLQRVPRAHEEELKRALDNIMNITGVHNIDNVHVWSFTNTDVVGTLHLHISPSADKDSTKAHVSHILLDAGINDLTIQTEYINDK